MQVNHGLRSCTEDIGVALFTLPSTHPVWPGRRLVLVDTPGFDDTSLRGDFETLRKISVWLADVSVFLCSPVNCVPKLTSYPPVMKEGACE
jgi:hypothetical protein